ncbi:MAG: ribose 5-phosphate isomerase B [Spirochaetaceae bacterium]|nr:ribose 5-phosphate isomerase B [Spirochaetaceae bacterium]
MRIIIANDHGALALKRELVYWMESRGHIVKNLGIDAEERVDYPDVASAACDEFKKGGYDFGILLCGTGIGISIAANKVEGIRCALVHDVFTAKMAREHNDANFIALGGRVDYAIPPTEILSAFISAKFEGGRHSERVAKIHGLERS